MYVLFTVGRIAPFFLMFKPRFHTFYMSTKRAALTVRIESMNSELAQETGHFLLLHGTVYPATSTRVILRHSTETDVTCDLYR